MKNTENLWTEEDYNNFCNTALQNNNGYSENDYCYIITINNKIFVTETGKLIWKRQNHASLALHNNMYRFIHKLARQKVTNLGIENYYRHPFYKEAYSLLIKELKDKGILKIIKIKVSEIYKNT